RSWGPVVKGQDLPLPMPAFKLRPTGVFHRLRKDDGYEFKGYRPEAQVIRVQARPADGTEPAFAWVPLGSRKPILVGDRQFVIQWGPSVKSLGFSLTLSDFHRDFYPGSTEESSFESYCKLNHPAKYPSGTDIKIDMNHPLRLDGWRLFQARFGRD